MTIAPSELKISFIANVLISVCVTQDSAAAAAAAAAVVQSMSRLQLSVKRNI
jgi:hypothetical protein